MQRGATRRSGNVVSKGRARIAKIAALRPGNLTMLSVFNRGYRWQAMGVWDNKVSDKTAERAIGRVGYGGDEGRRRGVTGAVINTNCKHLIRQHLAALIPKGWERAPRGSKILTEERNDDPRRRRMLAIAAI